MQIILACYQSYGIWNIFPLPAASDDVWTTREKVLAAFLCGSLLLSWHSYSYAFIYELAMLMILVISANRERKTGDHMKLFLLFLIIVACVSEHHLIEIQANPILLLVLAVDDGQRDDFHISRRGNA
ncbi:hypothetical protein ACTQZS_13985 [Bilifractor sp. LCP19S3_H10]|uniref:hypothetical protein n=1 Tax=Bilifractor sp. LCP19S3_H10 TaxID=3438736 RepID=UPI003F8F0916